MQFQGIPTEVKPWYKNFQYPKTALVLAVLSVFLAGTYLASGAGWGYSIFAGLMTFVLWYNLVRFAGWVGRKLTQKLFH